MGKKEKGRPEFEAANEIMEQLVSNLLTLTVLAVKGPSEAELQQIRPMLESIAKEAVADWQRNPDDMGEEGEEVVSKASIADLVIDRFEGDWAVLTAEQKTFNLPRQLLPKKAQEGDVVRMLALLKDKAKAERRKRVKDLMQDVFEGKDKPDEGKKRRGRCKKEASKDDQL